MFFYSVLDDRFCEPSVCCIPWDGRRPHRCLGLTPRTLDLTAAWSRTCGSLAHFQIVRILLVGEPHFLKTAILEDGSDLKDLTPNLTIQ